MPDKNNNTVFKNRYEVFDIIGEGASSVVYKAYDHKQRRFVALKLLRKESASDITAVQAFINESKAFAALDHENIISIYDVVPDENSTPYIVMELASGRSLKDYMSEKKGPLPTDEIINFASQIATALEYVHEHGIVHRDVKPQNIVFASNGLLKLTDFGIALTSNDNVKNANVSGTPQYMSPEQTSFGFVDKRSDIYSLGVTMYQMACGRLPFSARANGSEELYGKHRYESPIRPIEINPECPVGLSEIIDHCLRKDADERFEDCTQLLTYLKAFDNDRNVSFGFVYKDSGLSETGALSVDTMIDKFTPEVSVSKSAKEPQFTQSVKEKSDKKTLNTTPIVTLSAILIFITVLTVFSLVFMRAYIFKDATGEYRIIKADNYEGMNYTENLQSIIKNKGYKINIINEYDNSIGDNVIVSQSPKKNESILLKDGEDAVMTLTINVHSVPLSVPAVSGMSKAEGTEILKSFGLLVSVIERSDDIVAEGNVISTSPSVNETVFPGDEVVVYVSRGKSIKYTYVPNCVGMSLSDVQTLLASCGLKIGKTTFTFSDTQKSGYVAEQGRVFGEKVPSDITSVDLVISIGKQAQITD